MAKITKITKASEYVNYLVKKDANFSVLFNLIGEISYRLDNDYYGFIIKTIIGQMLSNRVSDIISERLKGICNTGKIDIKSMNEITISELKKIGLSYRKAQCIIEFTKYFQSRKITKSKFLKMSDEEIIKEITYVNGLGNWTAKMFLLFVMGREDIIPFEDTAYLQVFSWYNNLTKRPTKQEILNESIKWSPYNSIIARYFYISLDSGLTKIPFSSYANKTNGVK